MTEPEATDADRQEQQQLVTPPVPELADEVAPLADDVPDGETGEQDGGGATGRDQVSTAAGRPQRGAEQARGVVHGSTAVHRWCRA